MILALAAAVALATPVPLTPDDIATRAQQAWEARAEPPYLEFEIPCAQTFLQQQCEANAMATFIVRTSDGRTFARTTGNVRAMMYGGFITGPASTPLGFFRRIDKDGDASPLATPAPPPNFAPDPFGLRPIASVVSSDHAYTISLDGIETLDGTSVYHLLLRPNYDPLGHPLRELWVDAKTFQVLQLVYARGVDDAGPDGTVLYRFAQVGPKGYWAIVHIEAILPVKRGAPPVHLASDLTGIAFPEAGDLPPRIFEPSP
jgi:hypothetical protein